MYQVTCNMLYFTCSLYVIDGACCEQCCFTKNNLNSSVHQRSHMCNAWVGLLPLYIAFKCKRSVWCSLVQGLGLSVEAIVE